MEKEKVISNATVPILFSKLGRFDLLKNIFNLVFIPQAVKREILEKKEKSGEILLLENELRDYLKVIEIKRKKDLPLGGGESEATSLCLEKNIKIFLSDDKKAREIARAFGLETMGSLGILLKNLQNKKITKKEFLELLEKLLSKSYYISTELYNRILGLSE